MSKYDTAYYETKRPLVSDVEYDRLSDELDRMYEELNPEFEREMARERAEVLAISKLPKVEPVKKEVKT